MRDEVYLTAGCFVIFAVLSLFLGSQTLLSCVCYGGVLFVLG